MCFGFTASAQTQTLVYLEPSALTLAPGDTSVVHVHIDNAEDLYGFEVHLEFDPTLIQVTDSNQDTPGVQIDHGDVFNVDKSFVVFNRVDNEQGTIIYAITQLAPSEPVTGNGILLSLTVQATSLGISELTLSSVILASEAGESLPVESQNGQITVAQETDETATPIATATSAPPTATATPTVEIQPTATATPQNTPTTEMEDIAPTATLAATATKQSAPVAETNELAQTPTATIQTAPTSTLQEANSRSEVEPTNINKDDNNVPGGLIGLSIAGLGLALFFVIRRYSQKS